MDTLLSPEVGWFIWDFNCILANSDWRKVILQPFVKFVRQKDWLERFVMYTIIYYICPNPLK